MRLAVEVTTCTPTRSGIGYYTEHLVDALLETAASPDELVLISNRLPAPDLARRWAAQLRIGGSSVRAVWMQRDAPKLLVENRVDVAIFPNYVVPLASPCATIVVVHDLAMLRVPQFFTLRKRLLMRPLLRHSLARASAIATVSEASRRDIADRLALDAQRLAVLRGAAHPSCAKVSADALASVRNRYRIDRPYLLSVGTLEPRKNLLTLLDAFDLHERQSSELELLVVGGRGWQDRSLVRALDERRPHGRVRWLGYVPEQDLVALYSGAELFVYPSRLEGFGLPVVEAMACGTPVIASDVPALREVAGDAAVFVPPGDASAMAAAMSRLMSDPVAASHARQAGLERARSFSWTHTAQSTWALAREVGPARVPRSADEIADPLAPLPPTLDRRQWALLATTAYADLFDAPLPASEASIACIGAGFDEVGLRQAAGGDALKPHLVLHPSGYLVLAGREHLVSRMQEGAPKMKALLDQYRFMLAALATLPFVRMLALSGGTAHLNPGAKADIDIFVVTAAGRLYTTYTLLFLATKLTRTRRIVCPNYLIDETELTIAYHYDLFTAHQLVSTRPISGAKTYAAFCRANEPWVRQFFPAFRPREMASTVGSARLQRGGELLVRPFAEPLERALRSAWRLYLRPRAAKATRPDVVLADGVLKLHLTDYRVRVLQRFAQRLDAWRARLGAPASASAVESGGAERDAERASATASAPSPVTRS